jgi:hypothetical protein
VTLVQPGSDMSDSDSMQSYPVAAVGRRFQCLLQQGCAAGCTAVK